MYYAFLTFILLTCYSCNQPEARQSHTIIASHESADDCDNPDASLSCCFINAPAKLDHVMQISPTGEKGERMRISGIIYEKDGKTPARNALLYAYHTDNSGYYSKAGNETGVQKWHGRLHAWLMTNDSGRYEINSIRPAPYPNRTIPAHIHAAVKTADGRMQWIDDIVFKDDKLVNKDYIEKYGSKGVMELNKNESTWTGVHNVVLD